MIESPVRIALELPTVATLASIAAAIATPTEDPEVTAGRAGRLWMACRGQYFDLLRKIRSELEIGEMGEAAIEERYEFLSRCGLSRKDSEIAMRDDNTRVPLEGFLKACKPNPGTKDDYMFAKWRAFRERPLKRPRMSPSDVLDAMEAQMRRDREDGLPLRDLWHWWSEFTMFLFYDRKAKRSEKSKKGGRPKKPLEGEKNP